MITASFFAILFILLILMSIFVSNKAYKKGVKVKKVLLIQVLSFVFSLIMCSSIAFAVSSGEKGKDNSALVNSSGQISADSTGTVSDRNNPGIVSGTVTSSTDSKSSSESGSNSKGLGFIAMALCMGLACLGAGIAVAAAAPAAIGAITEDEKVFGKALIFVAMAEGVTVFGLLIAIFIYNGLN